MKFTRYDSIDALGADTLEILMENEVQNNLLISFIRNERNAKTSDWILTTIKDDYGKVVLTACCTPPFNLVVYETGNIPQEGAAELLAKEFKELGITIPGCLGEKNLAHRFAKIWTGGSEGEAYDVYVSMNCMQLDEISDFKRASGNSRPLAETDLYYVPYWETAFELECGVAHFTFNEFTEKLLKQTDSVRHRMDSGNHFIWEDGGSPVSQAYNHRNTENGAGIGGVYTPQHLRGKGYGASVVAQLSAHLLSKGHKFCFLFADAKNPISNGIYHKIGYYDVCVYDEIRFK